MKHRSLLLKVTTCSSPIFHHSINSDLAYEHWLKSPLLHSLAPSPILLSLLFFCTSSTTPTPATAASLNSSRPTLSASANTLVLTVAPSLRFFPSLLDCAIFSIKFHNLPLGTIAPVCASRSGLHSSDSLTAEGVLGSLFGLRTMMPSSSTSWNVFFRVSLLTAS